MPDPFAELPDQLTLTRDEVAVVLLSLDSLDEAGLSPDDAAKVRRAIRLLTSKLWPELGELLDDGE